VTGAGRRRVSEELSGGRPAHTAVDLVDGILEAGLAPTGRVAEAESPVGGRTRRERGFSLLELMIAAGVGCVAGGALFLLLQQIQGIALRLDSVSERDQNAALAPVLLVNWISPAGCGLEQDVEPPLSVESGVLSLRADIDGPDGFPDGVLEGSFESLRLRAAGGSLQLRSGSGSFQPFLKNIDSVEFSPPEGRLIRVELAAGGEAGSGLWRAGPRRVEVVVYLWNPAAAEGGR
jgi:hypothetical protein